ncbi:hypothetical protein [Caminibacter pacificus]|uniref:Uncharacterized protein n=1 Tax=Caminibacter pacificus TaxID=1424653 RepID=A0AAJ4RBC2_9BACT|nr:hypothetical protein [Caminibacter pacificus]QDD68218.1 hypothetical protein C6V80_10205 [Caminibacter pacificus]ROR38732.1 hypothetical protein EDC58_1947 [Caminibacter pacificus]
MAIKTLDKTKGQEIQEDKKLKEKVTFSIQDIAKAIKKEEKTKEKPKPQPQPQQNIKEDNKEKTKQTSQQEDNPKENKEVKKENNKKIEAENKEIVKNKENTPEETEKEKELTPKEQFEKLPEDVKKELKHFRNFFEINFNKIEEDDIEKVLDEFFTYKSEKELRKSAKSFINELLEELEESDYFENLKKKKKRDEIITIQQNFNEQILKDIPQVFINTHQIQKTLLKEDNIINAVFEVYKSIFKEDEKRREFFEKLKIDKQVFLEDIVDINFLR